jgi:hypothetical protein
VVEASKGPVGPATGRNATVDKFGMFGAMLVAAAVAAHETSGSGVVVEAHFPGVTGDRIGFLAIRPGRGDVEVFVGADQRMTEAFMVWMDSSGAVESMVAAAHVLGFLAADLVRGD